MFLIFGLAKYKGTGLIGAQRGRFGVEKKIRLINGPGPGFQGRPAGWVRYEKTRPEPNLLTFLVIGRDGHDAMQLV